MTETIASVAEPYWLGTGLGFLSSRPFYERMLAGRDSIDPNLLNLSGAAHFVLGMIILVNHFLWGNRAEITVTLLGMILVAKSALLILIPETALKSSNTAGKILTRSTVGFLTPGLYFCYVGYWPAT